MIDMKMIKIKTMTEMMRKVRPISGVALGRFLFFCLLVACLVSWVFGMRDDVKTRVVKMLSLVLWNMKKRMMKKVKKK